LQQLLHDVLSSYRQLRAALQHDGSARAEARNAILAQLDRLITPYFLSRTPAEWRGHLPRYLLAAQQRWEKLRHRRGKDAELEREVRDATERLERWVETLPPDWPWPPAVVRYRWLIEELRVSLFAQTLGTAAPVSTQRLEDQWRRVHEHLAPEERSALSSRSAR
jgi:ATP-dependent helicase HrpA